MAAIYIFSGLGTDERVFQYIDLSGFAVHYIQWITPFNDEPLADYAKRLSTQIHHRKPVFVGVSFGGMMAMEVAKYIAADKIILLASAKTKHEIPFYYRLAGSLQLYKILPARLLKHPNLFSYWLFGAKTKQDKKLLAHILQDTVHIFSGGQLVQLQDGTTFKFINIWCTFMVQPIKYCRITL